MMPDILGTMKVSLSDPVLIALIGGVATVLAALTPALINRRTRRRRPKRSSKSAQTFKASRQ